MTKKLPVLVTGGAGYIGSHAVLALAEAGWPVVVIDNLSTGFRDAVKDTVPFYEGDVADESLVSRIIADHEIGAIMHFAGSVIVPESVADPLAYYDNNSAKSRALIATAIDRGVRHFVFSSTAAVYGNSEAIKVNEDAPTKPANPYGNSKLMTEKMLADAARAHPLNYAALRYFNVAGADPQQRAGQSTAAATQLLKVAVEAATGKRDHVAIFGNDFDTPDGTGVRDYIHVTDLVDVHVLALAALIEQPDRSMTLNCGYGRGFSVLEVLDAVERATNAQIERRVVERREGDLAALIADNGRIVTQLGWQPRFDDLGTIVEHAVAWERKLAKRRGR